MICAPKTVCVSQVNNPWNKDNFNVATKTLETESSKASAILLPKDELILMAMGA